MNKLGFARHEHEFGGYTRDMPVDSILFQPMAFAPGRLEEYVVSWVPMGADHLLDYFHKTS